MLIGLNGRLKSGKDSTFKIIQDLYPEAERVSFAESLKVSAASSLKISRELMEALKEHENINFTIDNVGHIIGQLPTDLPVELTHWHMNMREYLQRYGTEAHRQIFGDSFWIDQALPLTTDHSNRLLVVTDMRFPNEVQRVQDLGGICVKVEREVSTAHGSHASEQNVDDMMDMTLDNTGTMDDLRGNVETLMHYLITKESQTDYEEEMSHVAY